MQSNESPEENAVSEGAETITNDEPNDAPETNSHEEKK
jgi:hypothetical protein